MRKKKTINASSKRIEELENAIRKHRSNRGHSLCWENDRELWSVLKDGETEFPYKTVPPTSEFLRECINYCGQIHKDETDLDRNLRAILIDFIESYDKIFNSKPPAWAKIMEEGFRALLKSDELF